MARPLKYSDPQKLEKAIDSYFKDNERPTLSGLAIHLGFESRQTLYNYKERNEFLDIVKKARAIVESKYEERLIYENNPGGVIFALKNMGWSDSAKFDHTSSDRSMSPPKTLSELYDSERGKRSDS